MKTRRPLTRDQLLFGAVLALLAALGLVFLTLDHRNRSTGEPRIEQSLPPH